MEYMREPRERGYEGGHGRGSGHGNGYGNQGAEPRGPNRSRRRKRCPFTAAGIRDIDYKDVEKLKRFITDRGKILPRRVTGVSAHHQRQLTQAIKRARLVALLPFVDRL